MASHNATCLRWHHAHGSVTGPLYEVAMEHNAGPGTTMALDDPWLTNDKFHELTVVAVGARVVYKTTTSKATGQTTSKLGTVQRVNLAPGTQHVQSLVVLLDGPERRTVTVSRCLVSTTHRHGHPITKKTFPLLLAYAVTAHRAQGATLCGTVILHVRNAFTPGITYVMLSRVTSRDNLRVLGRLTPADFTPISAGAFQDEGDAYDGSDLEDD